jgi:RNA polymerase I-specific transcription initiation factor RRN6
MLRLDNFDNAHSAKLIVNLNLARVHFKTSTGDSRGVGDDYHDRDVHFYQLSAVLDDLSVVQTMLCTLGHDSTDSTLENIEPTSWATTIKPIAFRANAVVTRDEDDFVQPDGTNSSKEPLLKLAFPRLKRYKENTHTSRGIFNFTSLYEVMNSNKPFPLHHIGTLSESMDIVALVEEIKWRLDREENVDPFTLGTLLEYAEAIVSVEDIDDASTKLQELSSTNAYVSSLEPRRIASDLVLGFRGEGSQEPSSLSSVYDLVLQHWVASLPENISARIRQSKERMVRRLATRLLLASMRIRPSNDGKNLPATQHDSNLHLAVTHSPLPQYSSQSDWLSQSSLPSDPISLDTPPISKASLSNSLARLSKHLHMINITPPEVPPSIIQVLSHWQLEADPAAYDWEATERAFAEELELEQEGMPKKRERARRKKERQVKRQKRENQLFTGRVESGKVESQPQLLRSSPGPAPAPAISSQVLAPNQSQPFVVQSQVEPGKHGGRPIKKKKVKSRMSGF